MICPKDNTPLVTEHRFTVEIDACPKCKGIWLDRDELNKILRIARGESPRDEKLTADDAASAVSTAIPAGSPTPKGGSGIGDDIVSFIGDLFGS